MNATRPMKIPAHARRMPGRPVDSMLRRAINPRPMAIGPRMIP